MTIPNHFVSPFSNDYQDTLAWVPVIRRWNRAGFILNGIFIHTQEPFYLTDRFLARSVGTDRTDCIMWEKEIPLR